MSDSLIPRRSDYHHPSNPSPALFGAAIGLGEYRRANRKLTEAQATDRMVDRRIDVLAHQKHGTTNTYACGCRCEECKAAMREIRARRRRPR